MQIDVCNGDADGLCSVVQWRLHQPRLARLVTGLKRDIALLDRVSALEGDELLVCDLSMRRNLPALTRLLDAGVAVRYFDHHQVDAIPAHPLLDAHIDTASDTCTSLLVDQQLVGAFRAWAVVGAFGDNLTRVADSLAVRLGLSYGERRRLQTLGESINYNAYGDSEQDVHIPPAQLYEILVHYPDPLNLLEQETVGQELEALRYDDMCRAQSLPAYLQGAHFSVHVFPNAPWSRRISGCWSNHLASAQPLQAHAVLTSTASADYKVSVRAPLCAPSGAVEFCRGFGGDGRAAAAGIDHLPADQMDRFVAAFSVAQWGAPVAPANSGC